MGNKRLIRITLYGVLLLAVMVCIFVLSSDPATDSAELSEGLLNTAIGRWIERLLPSITGKGIKTDIRKFAHIFEYFCLGVCAALFFAALLGESRAGLAMLTGELFSFLYSCSDEWHQTFVPGRSGEIGDVLFDLSGISAGVALVWIILILIGSLLKRRRA